MKRKLLGLAACALFAPMIAGAQTTGTISGKVTNDDGKPVPGATIRIVGGTQGAIAKADGSYLIAGVRAGDYELKATSIGLQPKTANIRVSVGQTTTANFEMSTKTTTIKEIVVTGRVIKPEKNGTVRTRTGEDISNSSRTTVQAAVALQSGVTTAGVNGFAIRGGRATETSIRVDGVEVSDVFSGGFGNTAAGFYPTISPLAVQEVQVISSGFSAEYGDILSGVVNSVTRAGRNDRYEGQFRFRTGVPALYGSSTPITVKKTGTDQDTTLPGAPLLGSGSKLYEFAVGGPMPGFDRLTFFFTGKYNSIPYSGSGYEVYDMSPEYAHARAEVAKKAWGFALEPTNLGQLPHQLAMIRDVNGKLKLNVTDEIFLEVGGEIGLTSSEAGGWGSNYQFDHPTFVRNGETVVDNSLLERDMQQTNQNTIINRANLRYFQNLDAATYFEVIGSWVRQRNESGKKDETKKYGMFDVFDIYGPDDKDNNVVIDRYEAPEQDIQLNQYLSDKISSFARNPITGLYEGGEVGGASRNPYGLIDAGNFPVHGNDRVLEVREATVLNLKGNYETNFAIGDVKTQVRAGFELNQSTLRRHENNLPWDPNPFFDVYGYDAHYFSGIDTTGTLADFFSKPYKPLDGALYVSTRFDYKSIVFQPGIRFDFINPNTKMPPSRRSSISEVVKALQTAEDASLKFQVSPRIGVSYPVTETSLFRVNFGVMFKMPDYNNLYDNAFGDAQRGNQLFGNPNIDPQKAFIYELGYEAQIAEDYYIDVSAYYRDIFNQTGITYVPALPSPYVVYSVSEYGNVRGIEISARKALTDNFSAELNYTLQKAVGTASSPEANYSTITGAVDPYTGEQQKLPLTEYPLNYDQTHNLNATVNLVWGDGQGPTIGGLKLLENTTIGVTGTFQTGLPYTRENDKGIQTTEFNSQRLPSQFTTEAHLERGFKLRDLLGEAAGRLEISFYADIYNLFNATGPVAVRLSRTPGGSRYSITGSPDYDGSAMNRKIGDFIATPHYRDVVPERPETWDVQQYDRFGTRFYNPYADSNLDGVVTQAERYEGYQRYISTIQTLRGSYQTPRTVAVGFRIRF